MREDVGADIIGDRVKPGGVPESVGEDMLRNPGMSEARLPENVGAVRV